MSHFVGHTLESLFEMILESCWWLIRHYFYFIGWFFIEVASFGKLSCEPLKYFDRRETRPKDFNPFIIRNGHKYLKCGFTGTVGFLLSAIILYLMFIFPFIGHLPN